jgi:IS5 family transposase
MTNPKRPQEAPMLIIAYPRDTLFLERLPFHIDLDPELVEMDKLLDDPKLILAATNDLLKSAPQAGWKGRPCTPVVVTLRGGVVRRLMDWSYRTLEKEVKGNVVWRWFCRIDGHDVPDHTTWRDREALLRPATLHRLNDRLVHMAQEKHITRGRKLRMDSTVIETDIHYPTDSRLLGDSVEVLGRLLSRAREMCRPRSRSAKLVFRNSVRSAKRLTYRISHRLRPRDGQKKPEKLAEPLYRQLVKLTRTTVEHADQVTVQLRRLSSPSALALAESLHHYTELVTRVIDQTVRRVFEHENVPAEEKIVSLFETHTAIIRRGKPAPHETEFGRKVWFGEVDGGIISEYRLLKGNPPDEQHFKSSVKQHLKLFGHPPDIVTGDRGVSSANNEHAAHQAGIEKTALPKRGAKDAERQAYEAQPWFKAALRFRAGIEGRISGLKRARGLDRCRNKGEPGMERWLGWGVIANNLAVIAAKLMRRRRSARTTTT